MSDLGGFSMFELFRQELEIHVSALEAAIDALAGESGDAGAAGSAMHAAHSLKGAARIIEFAPAEDVAGAMEGCFEAAGGGMLTLDAGGIETLRSGLAFLARLREMSEEQASEPSAELLSEGVRLRGVLDDLGMGRAVPAPAAAPEAAAVNREPAGSATGLAGLSMMDLFKVELENQAAQLNNGLLELESDLADPQRIEPVMRAAHSIKGASRIVGLDALTDLAHVLEDVFVAAQKGELALSEDHMDVVFRTSDAFSQLPALTGTRIAAWPEENASLIAELTQSLRLIVAGQTPPKAPGGQAATAPEPPAVTVEAGPSPQPAKPGPPPEAARKPSKTGNKERDGVVRVSSENLNRLMSFSAESLVQSSRLDGLGRTIMDHRRAHLRMALLIDRMQDEIANQPVTALLRELVREASDHNDAGLRAVADQQDDFDAFTQQTTLLSERLYGEVIASRMRPFSDIADGFRRQVRDTARAVGKRARLVIEGRSTPVDRDVLDDLQAPLNHILGNALDHGIEPPEERLRKGKSEAGSITLEVRHHAGMLLIEVRDDGRGIDLEELRRQVVDRGLTSAEMAANLSDAELLEFPFLPGFSTAAEVTEVSGRGVGLDVVQTMVREAGGTVRLSTAAGQGTAAHLHLPITRSVLRTMVAMIDGEPYAFPLTGVRRCLAVSTEEIRSAEGRQYVACENQNIGLVSAREALELGEGAPGTDVVQVVVLGEKDRLYGLEVDCLVGQADLVIRPLDRRLGKVLNINSAALLDDGSPVLIVDVEDLIRTIDSLLAGGRLGRARRRTEKAESAPRKTVLVVDDSITVRETERKLLENQGYEVDVAVDGVDGWNAIRLGSYDLIITDVDMPRMTGIELVRKIKADSRLSAIPVMIVSYKDREEDRMAGLDAGANYYLTKSSFKDEALLDAVADLIGEATE